MHWLEKNIQNSLNEEHLYGLVVQVIVRVEEIDQRPKLRMVESDRHCIDSEVPAVQVHLQGGQLHHRQRDWEGIVF